MNKLNQKIPEGWSVKKLSDLCSKISDGIHTTPKYVDKSEYHFINGNNLRDGHICIYEDTKCVSFEEYIKQKQKLGTHTLLMSINGTIGSLANYYNEDIVLGKSAAFMNFNDMQTKKYVYTILQTNSTKRYFENELTGSTIKNLSLKSIKSMKILLPPLPEQEKIAGILGTWDEAIEKLSNLIEQKKLLKKGLMQKLLTGKTRLPGFTQPWKEVKLGEMGHITSAGVDKNIVPGEQNVILLNYMDIYKKDFIYKDDIKQIVTAPDRKIKNCNVLMGDVFFTPSSETRDDIGHSAVIMENIPGAVYSYHIVRFRPLLNHLNRKFCAYAFKTSKFYKQAYSLCEGSGQRYVLSQDDFRNMKVYIPSDISEQQAIADVLSTADDEINLLNQKLEALKEQKKGLMQQLLTGQIRVKVN